MRFQDLLVYKKSFELAMSIYQLSKKFPSDEKYSLTDQIRRSLRSVSENIAEATRKRLSEFFFISKLTDSDAENSETQVWLEYALVCYYIEKEKFDTLTEKSFEVGKLLNYTMNNPNKFLYSEICYLKSEI